MKIKIYYKEIEMNGFIFTFIFLFIFILVYHLHTDKIANSHMSGNTELKLITPKHLLLLYLWF